MPYGVTRSPWVVVTVGLLVSACGAERPNVGPDKEPPELAIVSDIPLYTRAQSVSLNVKASDITGVKHVWYAVNNGSPIEVRTDAPQQEGALSVVAGTCEAGLTLGVPDESAASPDLGVASAGWNGVAASLNLSSVVELRNGSAAQRVGTRDIVPAADGSAPGVLYLYVTRPLAVSRTGPALDRHDQIAPYTNNAGTRYTYANDTPSPSGCCADGERFAPYGRCYIDIPLGLGRHCHCVMGTPLGPPNRYGGTVYRVTNTGATSIPISSGDGFTH
jgi:hypothetical protein